jgi:metallo-beta-lactamase class B
MKKQSLPSVIHGILFLLMMSTGFIQLHASDTDTIDINEDIRLIHIVDSVFIHESFHSSENWGRFSSNGMLIVRQGKAIMVDTPMDEEKTEVMLNYLYRELGWEVELFIAGHFHDDCMGGINVLHKQNIPSLACNKTHKKCRELGLPQPKKRFGQSRKLNFYGTSVYCLYHGPGHSIDNIVVWIPSSSVLFGGCMVRSMAARGPGNLEDAYPAKWLRTLQVLKEKYREARIVIPGHGSFGDNSLLDHSYGILTNYLDVH